MYSRKVIASSNLALSAIACVSPKGETDAISKDEIRMPEPQRGGVATGASRVVTESRPLRHVKILLILSLSREKIELYSAS